MNFSLNLVGCLLVACNFWLCVTVTCVELKITNTVYKVDTTMEPGYNNPAALEPLITPKLGCAKLCSEHTTCVYFNYDSKTKACLLTDWMIRVSGCETYVVSTDCPLEKGYRLYKHLDNLFCLKLNNTKVKQAIAVDECNKDGAQLVLITDEQMHAFIKDIVLTYGEGTVWVDGKDIYSNDTMYTYKGEPNPYIKWAFDDPGNGSENCLMISSVREYDFKDTSCSYEVRSVCERPLHSK